MQEKQIRSLSVSAFHLIGPTSIIVLTVDSWIQFPGVKNIDLYGKARPSAITIIDDRQTSDADRLGVSTGCANIIGKSRFEEADNAEVSRINAQGSSRQTDTRSLKVTCF